MDYRKPLYTVPEVSAAIANMGISRRTAAQLADLQQGILPTVVKFPAHRQGLTPVPLDHWNRRDGSSRYPERMRALKRVCTVDDFYAAEEALLRQANHGVALRNQELIPVEYRQHLETAGLLTSDMDDEKWCVLVRWVTSAWEKMSDLDGRDQLHPVVMARELNAYLKTLRGDAALNGKPTDRNPGGKPESPHWSVIEAEIIRTLASRTTILQSGKFQQFANYIYNKVQKLIPEGKDPVPQPETIAQWLRKILKVKD